MLIFDAGLPNFTRSARNDEGSIPGGQGAFVAVRAGKLQSHWSRMLTKHRFGTFVLAMAVASRLGGVAIAATVAASDQECGISYRMPQGWSASPPQGESLRANGPEVACSFELKPDDWSKLDTESKWGAGNPIAVAVYAPGTTLAAVREHVYDQNDKGEWGIAGRFSFGRAQRYRRGEFRGYVAFGSFRGFAKERSSNPDEGGDIYTGESATIIAASPSGRVVVIDQACGSPDVTIDCEGAIALFLHTLKFRRAPG